MKTQFFNKKTNASDKTSLKEKERNLYVLNEWNWKLEQSLMQLRSRINAIENRLSASSCEYSDHNSIHPESNDSLKSPADSIEHDMVAFKELIENYEQNLHHLEMEYDTIKKEVSTLMKKQRFSSVIMRVNGKEIPLEISGIIGGFLTIVIAILIGIGGINLVASPLFLSCIGCILIGSTFFRSFGGIHILKSWYKTIL